MTSIAHDVSRVRCQLGPVVDTSIAYQKYYLLGLAPLTRVRVEGGLGAARLAPGVGNQIRVLYRLAKREAEVGWRHGVCRYEAETPAGVVRFAIDARDTHAVVDEIQAASDVYFKSNRWQALEYATNVLPLVNGNGLLSHAHIRYLRSLRAGERPVDVAFIAYMWGGHEHNIRLFEELARIDCEKDLLAVFVDDATRGGDRQHIARLRQSGVECTYEPLPPRALWRRLASAKVVVIRRGVHQCIPWRMLDLLSMGACIVFDSVPHSQWPEPLQPGAHYADGGLPSRTDTAASEPEQYASISAAVRTLLASEQEQTRLRSNAARYYDDHAAPERVGTSILSRLT